MMKVDVYTLEGAKASQQADLPTKIFEAPVNVDLMHQAYVRQMANGRAGTHKTKTRSEVRGGGRKPWRQKGTGRARQGSTRSPQWVGGGRVHTPRPRDYSKDMPKKMRRAALRSALSVKAAEEGILVVDEIKLAEPKTKAMSAALEKLAGDATVLILTAGEGEDDANTVRSARNLASAKTLNSKYLNVRDLLGYDKVVVSLKSLDLIEGYLG
ncbi:MAG: 50S ribosomal protein L4 [Chloroflexi bacterium]|nr:MAG: 50S ribosomal protein L4 [Chloroflexota bacterium]MBL1196646.1 50S ribosomal protein L4 [Chloroflexota bacterium]NOH13939.1 50S ribosomal protein L4 [Chloroflexota bacterium]